MSALFKTPKFLKLQNKWYSKIKKLGFEDIETASELLKRPTSVRRFGIKTRAPLGDEAEQLRIIIDAKQVYYSMASQFLQNHSFDSKREKTIWMYHTEGLSVRDISDTLDKAGIPMSKDKVHRVVSKLRSIMKKEGLPE